MFLVNAKTNLPVARHCHYSESIFGVLVQFHITDVCCSILLALPARGSEIAIAIKFRVVKTNLQVSFVVRGAYQTTTASRGIVFKLNYSIT